MTLSTFITKQKGGTTLRDAQKNSARKRCSAHSTRGKMMLRDDARSLQTNYHESEDKRLIAFSTQRNNKEG
jgi:hypothetical protein